MVRSEVVSQKKSIADDNRDTQINMSTRQSLLNGLTS